MDRGGVSVKTEIEVTAKPYETVFESMESGSRASYRAGTSETHHALVDHAKALLPSDDEPIDVAPTLNSLIKGVSRINRSRCKPSAETPSGINRQGNVKHQPRSYSLLVERAGLEPATNGL